MTKDTSLIDFNFEVDNIIQIVTSNNQVSHEDHTSFKDHEAIDDEPEEPPKIPKRKGRPPKIKRKKKLAAWKKKEVDDKLKDEI